MECSHRELRSRLADRLGRDYADRFADIDNLARRKIPAVTLDAHTAPRFARQHRADSHPLDSARVLNLCRDVFGDLLVRTARASVP